MSTYISYGSKYGCAKDYARKLADLLGATVLDSKKLRLPGDCDRLIHVGSLYASAMVGLKPVLKALSGAQSLVLVTVGISDVHNSKAMETVTEALRKQLPENRQNTVFYHLPGALDYSTMSFLHRQMMGMLIRGLKAKPADQRPADVQKIIDSYGKKLDLRDDKLLEELAQTLRQGFK